MLDVYLYGEHVGRLGTDERGLLSFHYTGRALDEPERFALSVRLPVRPEPYGHQEAMAFFDNLLPESDARDLIAQARHYDPSDVVGLLGAIGGECAGAVALWPEGTSPPREPQHRLLNPEEIGALYDRRYGAWAADAQVSGRMSMSGAQQKMVFLRRGDDLYLPLAGSPSNVLVKRPKPLYEGLALNELACMRIMAAAGLPTAQSAVCDFGGGPVFESLRYDRIENEDGSLVRLHQEDLCQATSRRPAQKYQSRGGPAYGEVAQVLRRHSADPLEDLAILARWAFLNLMLGNNDAHAKNLSLLYTNRGIRLAPIYDVLSTHVYPHIDRHFALDLGGQRTVEGLSSYSLGKFVRSLGMKPRVLARLVTPAIELASNHAPDVLHIIATDFGHAPVLDAIEELINERQALLIELLSQLESRS